MVSELDSVCDIQTNSPTNTLFNLLHYLSSIKGWTSALIFLLHHLLSSPPYA